MTGVLDALTAKPVVVVCGAGGVGKTTIAAAIAVGLARRGQRVCVVTVDPARRLAGALGIATPSDVPVVVAGDWPGSLEAVQLHAASTFDALIVRHAASDAQATAIRRNPLYRSLASALGGTQEYMAMERLYELHHADTYDVVVVDTPPTRNALELLDAPQRLLRFLGHRVVRTMLAPTRFSLRAASAATSAFLRGVAAVVGGELVEDAVSFFQAFAGMQQGFADRAGEVQQLLAAPSTAFVLVTTPTPDALEEAAWFTSHLSDARRDPRPPRCSTAATPRSSTSDPATLPSATRHRRAPSSRSSPRSSAPRATTPSSSRASRRSSGATRSRASPSPRHQPATSLASPTIAERAGRPTRTPRGRNGRSGTLRVDGTRARGERPAVAAPLAALDARGARARGPRGVERAPRPCGAPSTEEVDLAILDLQIGSMGAIAICAELRNLESATRPRTSACSCSSTVGPTCSSRAARAPRASA